PWFILWFLFAALLNTFGVIPAVAHPGLTQLALFLIVLALSGVGLSADFAKMRAAGLRPLALGFVLWVTIAASSLLIAHVAQAG
ncbi:MAG: putative sulfate exporter family transporter, partial [Vulcanimicrobiaceae bacterium]